jgi:hypothetical protein
MRAAGNLSTQRQRVESGGSSVGVGTGIGIAGWGTEGLACRRRWLEATEVT